MGSEFMRECPVFRAAVRECDEAMRPWLGRSLIEEIHGPAGDTALAAIDAVQPALFAMAVGLAARWRSLGIEPAAVVGHSMGEVAAAYVAGALSLADAAQVICRRSALLRRVSGAGAMLVVALPMAEAAELVADRGDRVSVAVSNSPTSTVLSGDPVTLNAIREALAARNVFSRPVRVDVASHSPQMDPLRDDLLAALEGVRPRPGRVPILSTVTGAMTDGSGFDADYWVRNLRAPVLFWPAVQALVAAGNGAFVEVSPHPLLLGAVEEAFETAGAPGLALPSMRRDEPEDEVMRESFGALYANGLPVDLPRDGRPVPLPPYAWQRIPLWYRDRTAPRQPAAGAVQVATPPAPAGALPTDQPAPALVATLRATPPRERRAAAAACVRDAVVKVLHVARDRVDPGLGIFQMGMDSMLATKVRGRIEAAVGHKLPAAVMFEHPTVDALAGYLVQDLVKAGQIDDNEIDDEIDENDGVAALAEELSESELLALLADEVRASARQAGEPA
jgi:myxalamid-type polyketide synthase MxaE and MxaD